MKKVWKWVLGILLGLLVIGLLVGAGFLMRTYMHPFANQTRSFTVLTDGNPKVLQFQGNERVFGPGMMQAQGFGLVDGAGSVQIDGGPQGIGRSRMLCGRGFSGGIVDGLLKLGLLTLVVLGIIWMIRGLRKPKQATSVEPVVASPAVITSPCKKCGEPVQEGWKVCPNCGKKI
jgi:hypothetical protein